MGGMFFRGESGSLKDLVQMAVLRGSFPTTNQLDSFWGVLIIVLLEISRLIVFVHVSYFVATVMCLLVYLHSYVSLFVDHIRLIMRYSIRVGVTMWWKSLFAKNGVTFLWTTVTYNNKCTVFTNAVGASSITLTLSRCDTIRYLRALKSWRESQLNITHGTKREKIRKN